MNKLTFSLETDDWVWLCEILAEISHEMDNGWVSVRDRRHIISTLQAVESAT